MRVHLADIAHTLTTLGGASPAGAVVAAEFDGDRAIAASGWALRPTAEHAGEPMRADMLFDIASVTKVCTTIMLLRLADAGHLDLDAPVREHLPDMAATITAEHLLRHRAGLAAWFPLYTRSTDREAALDLAEQLPLAAEPDTVWRYSDIGMMLLGRLIERITGTSLQDAFTTLVAEPLHLHRTGWGPVDPRHAAAAADNDDYEYRMIATGKPYPVDAVVSQFQGWRTSTVRGAANDGNTAHALAGCAGHAGVFSPVDELLTIGGALVDPTFISMGLQTRALTGTVDAPHQGLGIRRMTFGPEHVLVVGHAGFTGTFLGAAVDRPLQVAVAATRLHGNPPGTAVSTDTIRDTAIAGILSEIARAHPNRTPDKGHSQ
ncbi:serine hydrolase domain-containing protein [Curtobacterium luteum]|uniref:serine hydrolase domain-containing protein n=1 Tax=Curtobacterium luteum TaxID=33881 RepID=UPI003810373E